MGVASIDSSFDVNGLSNCGDLGLHLSRGLTIETGVELITCVLRFEGVGVDVIDFECLESWVFGCVVVPYRCHRGGYQGVFIRSTEVEGGEGFDGDIVVSKLGVPDKDLIES